MEAFAVLFVLYLYIMTLIGEQFFANRFRFDKEGFVITEINSPKWVDAAHSEYQWPRGNFDDFTHSFVNVFQCLTIDRFFVLMYDCRRAVGPAGMLFPIAGVVVGAYIVMNVFLAMLIENFAEDIEQHVSDIIGEATMHVMKAAGDAVAHVDLKHLDEALENVEHAVVQVVAGARRSSRDATPAVQDLEAATPAVIAINGGPEPEIDSERDVLDKRPDALITPKTHSGRTDGRVAPEEGVAVQPPPSGLDDIRARARALVTSDHFEYFILVLIVISSVTLAVSSPLNNPKGSLEIGLRGLDSFMAIIFLCEMLAKWFAFGLVRSPDGYFCSGWNWLDFVVVVVSLVDMGGVSSIKALRAMRALRPLRLIRRIESLRVIVVALIHSLPAVSQVVIIFFLVYYIFAILFVSYLKGNFRSCQGYYFDKVIHKNYDLEHYLVHPVPWSELPAEKRAWFGPASKLNKVAKADKQCAAVFPSLPCCPAFRKSISENPLRAPSSKTICECWGAEWDYQTQVRFDNVGQAMLSLFQIGTLDFWTDYMYQIVDANGIDMQPKRDADIIWYYVVVLFVICGFYLCIKLFVGVIVESFMHAKAHMGHDVTVTREQADWIKTKRMMMEINPKKRYYRPPNIFRGFVFDIINNRFFDGVIMCAILTQILVLAVGTFGESTAQTDATDKLNIVLGIIFFVEAALKIIALGPTEYFAVGWNILDFLIVCGSIASFIVLGVTGSGVGLIVNLIRMLRIGKVFRLIKALKSLQKLVNTLILTMPSIANITVLLLLMIYIFAVVAVQLFSKTAFSGYYGHAAHFRTFGMAYLTLLRFVTGEGWTVMMWNIYKDVPGCVKNPSYDPDVCGFNPTHYCMPLMGCGSVSIVPFLLVYMVSFWSFF